MTAWHLGSAPLPFRLTRASASPSLPTTPKAWYRAMPAGRTSDLEAAMSGHDGVAPGLGAPALPANEGVGQSVVADYTESVVPGDARRSNFRSGGGDERT